MALCEVALSDGSDLLAKEMEFGQGWNSPSLSKCSRKKSKFLNIVQYYILHFKLKKYLIFINADVTNHFISNKHFSSPTLSKGLWYWLFTLPESQDKTGWEVPFSWDGYETPQLWYHSWEIPRKFSTNLGRDETKR